MARYRQCDGITRRNLLQAGLVGGLGLNLASYQRLLAAGALADRPRAKGAIFIMLAGGDVAQIGLNSPEAAALLGNWRAEGGSDESLIALLKPVDPCVYGKNVHGRKIIMYNATKDEIIPRACTDSLWKAFGEPEIHWVEAGHYSVARFMFDALGRATRLFQGLPSEPAKALPSPKPKNEAKLEAAAAS